MNIRRVFVALTVGLMAAGTVTVRVASPAGADLAAPAPPVPYWSTEARRAIVPPAAGPENFGNKFPGEAAVYIAIAHAAIYDATLAVDGGYAPYAIALTAPTNTSREAAVATAAHHTLIGLRLGLTTQGLQILNDDYAAYLDAIPDDAARQNGIAVGEQVSSAILALRDNDGREKNPTLSDLHPLPPGAGVWQPNPAVPPNPPPPVLGLRMPGIRPLALQSAIQFRPDGPNAVTSQEYAEDFEQTRTLGDVDSTARKDAQTTQALFWTDHDLRQWNDAMLHLADSRGLDAMQTARMLAMAHVAGADAMIACFDAKYHYWFWRPFQAIQLADTDDNPATEADPTWIPLVRNTPNFPEYPSAHACHSTALAETLAAFFHSNKLAISINSRVTNSTRTYERLQDVIKDVNAARVLVGFHFRNSDQEGSTLGRKVARYVADHFFGRL